MQLIFCETIPIMLQKRGKWHKKNSVNDKRILEYFKRSRKTFNVADEKEKAYALAESEIQALKRKITLLEEELERSESEFLNFPWHRFHVIDSLREINSVMELILGSGGGGLYTLYLYELSR
jgi:hypothetical protein